MGEQNGAAGQTPTCSIEEFSSTAFDYIICGGGTAGLVIAARLTENPEVTVGVIEAGKYRIGDPLVDMPAGLFQMLGNPEYDWCMYTAPQVGSRQSSHVLFPFLQESIGREQWKCSPYPSRKVARRVQRHQLHDVRARQHAGLQRLG